MLHFSAFPCPCPSLPVTPSGLPTTPCSYFYNGPLPPKRSPACIPFPSLSQLCGGWALASSVFGQILTLDKLLDILVSPPALCKMGTIDTDVVILFQSNTPWHMSKGAWPQGAPAMSEAISSLHIISCLILPLLHTAAGTGYRAGPQQF